jgi:hypothetical protein
MVEADGKTRRFQSLVVPNDASGEPLLLEDYPILTHIANVTQCGNDEFLARRQFLTLRDESALKRHIYITKSINGSGAVGLSFKSALLSVGSARTALAHSAELLEPRRVSSRHKRRMPTFAGRHSTSILEREKGFEPSTSTLARWHSTAELLPQRAGAFLAVGAGSVKELSSRWPKAGLTFA